MLPLRAQQYIQGLEALFPDLRVAANGCPINFQHVYASYLAVKASAMIEVGTREILAEYAVRNANPLIKRYIETTVAWENALNCDKIQRLLSRFDPAWWPAILVRTTDPQRSAVDSLKTLRDQFAHGQPNGTGYLVIEAYHFLAKSFLTEMANELVP